MNLKELLIELLELRSIPQFNESLFLVRDDNLHEWTFDVYLIRNNIDHAIKFCLVDETLYITTYLRAKDTGTEYKSERVIDELQLNLADPNFKELLRDKTRIIF